MNAPVVNTGEEHLVHCKNCGARTPLTSKLRCPECNIRFWGYPEEGGILQDMERGEKGAWLVELPLFRIHEITEEETRIGRSSGEWNPEIDCSRDPMVSRKHAHITLGEGEGGPRLMIHEGWKGEKSRNGTLLNEDVELEAGNPVVLEDGDFFRAGNTLFTVIIRTGGAS